MKWRTICGAALMIALYACAQTPASTLAPSPTVASSPAPVTPTASPVPMLKVKKNNLLFVEFFGIT